MNIIHSIVTIYIHLTFKLLFLCAYLKLKLHGTSNSKIMSSISNKMNILELIKLYAFNAVFISLDKSVQTHKCTFKYPQRQWLKTYTNNFFIHWVRASAVNHEIAGRIPQHLRVLKLCMFMTLNEKVSHNFKNKIGAGIFHLQKECKSAINVVLDVTLLQAF